jgi:thioredoxin-like negative regulator of GroEL
LNFDEQVLQSELPVRVDYWAEWCAPGKTMVLAASGCRFVFRL